MNCITHSHCWYAYHSVKQISNSIEICSRYHNDWLFPFNSTAGTSSLYFSAGMWTTLVLLHHRHLEDSFIYSRLRKTDWLPSDATQTNTGKIEKKTSFQATLSTPAGFYLTQFQFPVVCWVVAIGSKVGCKRKTSLVNRMYTTTNTCDSVVLVLFVGWHSKATLLQRNGLFK